MAIQLYREGDTHEVRGIKCELANFKIKQLEACLNDGWVKQPEDINAVSKESEEDQASESESVPEQKLNPIRLKAKEASIEGWDTKRIKTLEIALNGTES